MQIEIKDLEVGDEILTTSGSDLRYVKVLKAPQIRTKLKRWHATNIVYYKAVKCSMNCQTVTVSRSYTSPNGSLDTRSWQQKKYICTSKDHNMEKFMDLNEKTLWLIKKNSF